MYQFNQSQPSVGLNLSATGAPAMNTQQPQFTGLSAPQQTQQPNPLMAGILQGAGVQQQYNQAQQYAQQQPFRPPSEMELLNALLQSQNPLHRFISSGGLGSLIELLATATTLSMLTVLKDAKFIINDDEGEAKIDMTSLPDNLKTLSSENVSMLLNNLVNNSTQTIQAAEAQRQQILALSQQSIMGDALQAALADEGTMQKIGGGIGSVARSFMGLPKQ